MNDDLQPLKNRLRWLNRSILALGVLILLGLVVWAVQGLRKPQVGTTSTTIHAASSVPDMLTPAASQVAASPKPVASMAQQEKTAAAQMNALSAASTPTAAVLASQPAAPSERASQTAVASVAAESAPQAAVPQAAAPETVVKPKATAHKAATHATKQTSSAVRPVATKPQRIGTVHVCHAAGWYLQVGAFGKQHSIDRLAQRLHRAGYSRVCVAAKDVRGLRLFYVGPYRNADAARAARAPLHKLTGTEGILRKLP